MVNMMMKKQIQILTIAAAALIAGCAGAVAGKTEAPIEVESRTLSGQYLASHFAQSRYDWGAANTYLGRVLEKDPGNVELLRRSMILAMGTGDIDLAARRAEALVPLDDDNGLALMILAVRGMAANDIPGAADHLDAMKPGDMADFVRPVLKGWTEAAQGRLYTEGFNQTTIHLYHGALLATFLDKKAEMKTFTDALLQAGALAGGDAERSADMLAVLGDYKQAAVLYEGVNMQDSDNSRLASKLAEIKKKDGGKIREMVEPLKIKSIQQGAAMALYDMAYILYQEQSDSSAQIFARMALSLDVGLVDARLLLADTLTRNGRFDEAIAELGSIPADHPSYLTVQRHAADLLDKAGRTDEALKRLNTLFTDYNDVESLIRIGDIYRNAENYKNALTAYNKAAKRIGGKIPEKYWYLLYARGMAYEREGNWDRAESDLKAALTYRPDHPYLLNYLGYGWADQGMHLEESLDLIKRAVSLQPADGYIIDSLGWVQYMMGLYSEALPNVEKAVELLPYDATINDHLGDVYWQTGRRMEARFQWERALNASTSEPEKERINQKLRFGLEGLQEMKRANAE